MKFFVDYLHMIDGEAWVQIVCENDPDDEILKDLPLVKAKEVNAIFGRKVTWWELECIRASVVCMDAKNNVWLPILVVVLK